MIGSYAGIAFTVSPDTIRTFTGLTRSTGSRYANHEVIGAKPVKEYLGPSLMGLSFTMELSVDRGVIPAELIRKLGSFMAAGSNSPFILGGKNMGTYSILTKGETYDIVSKDGVIVSCSLDLELEEYT